MGPLPARMSIDTGGTFTDIVLIKQDGTIAIRKVDNSSPNQEENILRGALELLTDAATPALSIVQVVHCTTLLGNAVIQRQGPKTGLITTKGFRDILELRRQRYPRLYDVFWKKPPPLVPRYLRREVTERIGANGEVVIPLDVVEVREALKRFLEEGVTSVAICFINSYANATHEQEVGRITRENFPSFALSISSDLSPEWGEYERTSTTVTDAFVKPVLREYVGLLQKRLGDQGIKAPLYVMQSSGGIMSAETALERPVFCLESGPAAGVMATCALGKYLGVRDAVTLEMGGTTAKSSLIERGQPRRVSEYEIGTPVALGGGPLKSGGYVLRIPVIDMAEVGAGGGSIAQVDGAGSLRVGPEGAGAIPGPVCYDRGGVIVTLTDANVVLGFLREDHPLGGEIRVKKAKAEAALAEQIARPLNLSLLEAAYAVRIMANATLARAIRAISTERGRDVRNSALFAFGGGGPGHAAEIARLLGIRTVIVPPLPGLFSALGLLWSPLEHHFSRAARVRLDDPCAFEKLSTLYLELESTAKDTVLGTAKRSERLRFRRYADLHYLGQFHELTVRVPRHLKSPDVLRVLRGTFEMEHQRTYGYHAPEESVEVRNIRVVGHLPTNHVALQASFMGLENLFATLYVPSRQVEKWKVYFGKQFGEMEVPVLSRADLNATSIVGPVIIPEYDTTIVVPPDFLVKKEKTGSVVLESM